VFLPIAAGAGKAPSVQKEEAVNLHDPETIQKTITTFFLISGGYLFTFKINNIDLNVMIAKLTVILSFF
jgi:hypothetical protein